MLRKLKRSLSQGANKDYRKHYYKRQNDEIFLKESLLQQSEPKIEEIWKTSNYNLLSDENNETSDPTDNIAFSILNGKWNELNLSHSEQLDSNKIFASEWLDDNNVLVGTKGGKLVLLDTSKSVSNIKPVTVPSPYHFKNVVRLYDDFMNENNNKENINSFASFDSLFEPTLHLSQYSKKKTKSNSGIHSIAVSFGRLWGRKESHFPRTFLSNILLS